MSTHFYYYFVFYTIFALVILEFYGTDNSLKIYDLVSRIKCYTFIVWLILIHFIISNIKKLYHR